MLSVARAFGRIGTRTAVRAFASETDYWKIFPRMPRKVVLGDITVRDGFQHEEKFVSTDAKKFYIEELIAAGCRHIEITNLGNPAGMPQFRDGVELLKFVRSDKFVRRMAKRGVDVPNDVCFTAVTIREPAVDRAIQLREEGIGPDRILMMVSTEEEHHFANSGTTQDDYFKEAERCIAKAADHGIKVRRVR
jgi:hydroxymethylglutaryl-CoA lyase